MENSNAVELVRDIREEFVWELEEVNYLFTCQMGTNVYLIAS